MSQPRLLPDSRTCTECGKGFRPHDGTYGLMCPHCGRGQKDPLPEIAPMRVNKADLIALLVAAFVLGGLVTASAIALMVHP